MHEIIVHWVLFNIILGLLGSIVFIANMSSDLKPSSTGFAWLAIIFFLPVVGIPLYLIFGGKKLEGIVARKPYIYRQDQISTRTQPNVLESILAYHHIPATTEHNKVEIIGNGEDAYDHLTRLIGQAQTSIEIQTYIIGNDDVGDAILEHLVKKAQEGVTVRLLLDGLFAFVYPGGKLKKLRKAGVNVYLFLPLRFRIFRSRINLRNHRKLLIVDRQFAIMGGMNLAKNYMGPTKDSHRWCDIAVRLKGDSVEQLVKSFCSDWNFASRQSIKADCHASHNMVHVSAIQVVPSGPDVEGYPFYDTLLTMIYNAKEKIEVVTPYFVPDLALYTALSLAAFRGVQVTIIVPQHSNHPLADFARARHVRYLTTAGVTFLFFEPTMIHAKVITVDEEVAIVGSANFDMRSLFFNFESCLYFYSKKDIVEVQQWIDALKEKCTDQYDLPDPKLFRLMLENVVSLLSPLL